jgi:hypothetical protein
MHSATSGRSATAFIFLLGALLLSPFTSAGGRSAQINNALRVLGAHSHPLPALVVEQSRFDGYSKT